MEKKMSAKMELNRIPKLIADKRVIVFDLETKTLIPRSKTLSDEELIGPLEIAAGGYYDSQDEQIHVFSELTIDKFIEALKKADLVVSYNGIKFDYLILKKYLDFDPETLPTWDLYARIKEEVSFRPSLNGVAMGTLGTAKSGDGADAPALFQKKRWNQLRKYVEDDVRITRDIFYAALNNGQVEYVTQKKRNMVIDTSTWTTELQKVIYNTEVLPGDWIIVKTSCGSPIDDQQYHSYFCGVDIYNLNGQKIDEVLDIRYEDGAKMTISNYEDNYENKFDEVLCKISSMDLERTNLQGVIWDIDDAALLPMPVLNSDLDIYSNYSILERIYGSLYIAYADYLEYGFEEVLPTISEATGREFVTKRYGQNIAIKRDWS